MTEGYAILRLYYAKCHDGCMHEGGFGTGLSLKD